MNSRLVLVGSCWLAVLMTVLAADSDPQLEQDHRILKEAGLPSEGASLLDFFQKRSLADVTRQRLIGLVKQLGHDDFAIREQATKELMALGPAAEPVLERAASDTDVEIATRAKRCLEGLNGQRAGPELLRVAVRVLGVQKPARTLEILLAYLPSAHDETLEDDIVALLARLNGDGPLHSALEAAVADPLVVRRLATVAPLVRAGGAQRTRARQFLQDPDPRVRLAAARALVHVRDKTAVPVLIALLGEGPLPLLWHAEDQLCRIAGDQAPQLTLDPSTAAGRHKYRDAWDSWWKVNENTIDLARLATTDRLLGLTVVADFDGGPGGQGQVWECDAAGTVRWKIQDVFGPADVQVLPTGRFLIAEHNASRVTERTRDGKIVWETAVTGNPITAQRLANGNTFIATYTDLLKVGRDGRRLYTYQKTNSIYCAQKLPNGHIFYIHSNGHIVELDLTGKEVRSIPAGNTTGWGSVELLANGHFLVALYSASKVREIDANGKVYLDCSVPQATFATRLSNGHTLTADSQNRRIIEFDPLGKEVWRQKVEGRPFCVRRR